MNDIFMFLITNMVKFGVLTRVTFYNEEFASIEFETNGKKYSINLHCEGIKEEEKND